MALRYWVGGTAAWDGTAGTKWALTSGGAGGQAIPTAADDVFFDAASGAVTCTISTGTTVAKSINCTGFTGTLTGTAARTVSGSVTLHAGMTMSYTGPLTISGTGNIISAGKTFGSVTVNGVGITVTLSDSFISSTTLTLTNGTLNSNNFNVTANIFSSSNSNTRTLTMGSSSWTLTGTGTVWSTASITGLTLNANTSTISVTGVTTTFNTGSLTFYNLSFTPLGPATTIAIAGAAITFNNLSFSGVSGAGAAQVSFSGNHTVNGTLTVTTANATRRVFFRSSVKGTPRTITCAAVSLNDTDFSDIIIAGVAAPATGTRLGDCKGNSGITFPAAKTVYWNLAGVQNWSATGWAPSDGGTPAIDNFPLAQDTAVFTNSGFATLTITFDTSSNYNIGTISIQRTNAMTLDSNLNTISIYGNWTSNATGTTLSGTGTFVFCGRNANQSITSNGVPFTQPITLDSSDGTLTFQDAFRTSGTLTVQAGTLNANNFNVTAGGFFSSFSTTRTVTMGSGLWTLSGTGNVWSLATTTNLIFNKGTADILLSDTTSTGRTFAGGNFAYNKLTIGGVTGTSTTAITGANTFSEIASTKTVAHTIVFSASSTHTVTTWSVKGSSGAVVSVTSNTAGVPATLAKTGGGYLVGIDYLRVRDLLPSPISDTWYIGTNSTHVTTTPNSGAGMFTTQRATNAVIVLTSTASANWTVPTDWNNSNNNIHLFGGGGGSGGASANTIAGGGGGGGGYTRIVNKVLTKGSLITYQAGSGGTAGSNNDGGDGSTTSMSNPVEATAGGGGGGKRGSAGPIFSGGGGGLGGVGTTFNGGEGGNGGIISNGAGGGGGGAGGPNGVGGAGGNGTNNTTASAARGGGGGGNGGGQTGANGSVNSVTAFGGNNSNGFGGAPAAVGGAGAVGGGGAGGRGDVTKFGGRGSRGIDIFGIGGGGGSGGGAGGTGGQGGTAELYGGGAGSGTNNGMTGAQGVIIITYKPFGTRGNFFKIF